VRLGGTGSSGKGQQEVGRDRERLRGTGGGREGQGGTDWER